MDDGVRTDEARRSGEQGGGGAVAPAPGVRRRGEDAERSEADGTRAPRSGKRSQAPALALLGLLVLVGCGGPLADEAGEAGEAGGAAQGQDALQAGRSQAASDEAEQRLDGEGAEDDDTAMEQALSAHGFEAPAIELLRADGLRAVLLEVASAAPGASAGTLVQRTLDRWQALAARGQTARLEALGALNGFDPRSAPVQVDAATARRAASAPESALDARGRRQVTQAQARAATAISAHLDLSPAEATDRLGALAISARRAGADAAGPFEGTLASSLADPGRGAARALRRAWQALTDRGFDDEAWPAIAALLGRPLPPPPSWARPGLLLLDPAGLACAVIPPGLACQGRTKAGTLRIALDGLALELPVGAGVTAQSALAALRLRLPAPVAGCTTGREATLLRLDRTAPSLEGTPLLSATLGLSHAPGRPQPEGPPRELLVRGRFRAGGLRPAFLVDFSGCELRVELIAQHVPGAPRDFEARLTLSSRLPDRGYEALLTDETGRTLAAAWQ